MIMFSNILSYMTTPSGIFTTPNIISKNVASPAMSILIWFFGGMVASIGGITFCELGTMFPCNGAEVSISI